MELTGSHRVTGSPAGPHDAHRPAIDFRAQALLARHTVDGHHTRRSKLARAPVSVFRFWLTRCLTCPPACPVPLAARQCRCQRVSVPACQAGSMRTPARLSPSSAAEHPGTSARIPGPWAWMPSPPPSAPAQSQPDLGTQCLLAMYPALPAAPAARAHDRGCEGAMSPECGRCGESLDTSTPAAPEHCTSDAAARRNGAAHPTIAGAHMTRGCLVAGDSDAGD